MVDALGVTAASMVSDVTRLNTISHNLANSGTVGFKKALSVSRPFTEHLGVARASLEAVPVGMAGVESVVDFRPGALNFSGNPLDLAIEDEGFFEVMTENGPAYTRQGSFRLDGLGRLISDAGHAVMGTSGQRCWMEREQVSDRGSMNVPGALMGAVIGGILGHQVGSGRGNDAATVGGVVAGGAIGANVGRDGGNSRYAYGQDVQRCSGSPEDATPNYWDVTYRFRDRDHRVQMASPPGRTIRVNSQGEPRV